MSSKELLDILYEYENVVLFGFGKVGKSVYDFIQGLDVHVNIIICDNNVILQGAHEGYIVYSVEKAIEMYPECPVILATINYKEQMIKQLLSLHVREELIINENITQLYHQLLIEQRRRQSITPWDKIPFEVHLAEHCNLNCASCAHFSSIASEEYCSFEEYKKDIERMSFLLNGEAGEIHILGGEPLMNNRINDYLKVMRTYFKSAVIGIVTNGILLDRMNQEFWDTCHNYDITLMVTQYPIRVKYEEFLKKAKQENIKYIYFRNTDNHCYMNKYPLDIEGNQDYKESFLDCEMSNKCILLKKGKLYTCSVVGNIEHFNRYFGKNLEVSGQDFIDIYQVESKEEIAEALAAPIPFCRYCDVKNRKFNLDWTFSKKEISEWIDI